MELITQEKIVLITGFLLIGIGLWAILSRSNIIKIIIGFSLFDTGIHMVMVSIAYVKGNTAPILNDAVEKSNAAAQIVDPVPQALVLTAIVIGLGITALMLVFALKMYKKKETLEINNYKELRW